jgi:hypothetical protein
MRIMKKFPPPGGSGGCVELAGTMMIGFVEHGHEAICYQLGSVEDHKKPDFCE